MLRVSFGDVWTKLSRFAQDAAIAQQFSAGHPVQSIPDVLVMVYLYKGCYVRLIAVSTSANDGGMTTLCAFEYSAAKCNTRKHFSFHSYVADTTPFAEVETAIWS